jgi:hypothetical protein
LAAAVKLNAQSYPSWDNTPNTDLTTYGPSYILRGAGIGQYVYYIGETYYLSPYAVWEMWRWSKCSGWEKLGGFGGNTLFEVNDLAIQGHFLYVGGLFDYFGYGGYGLYRFNADGTLDDTFNIQVNGSINKLVQQPDGKILVVGSFSVTDNLGQTQYNIVRLINHP